jgi:hypothetical protein
VSEWTKRADPRGGIRHIQVHNINTDVHAHVHTYTLASNHAYTHAYMHAYIVQDVRAMGEDEIGTGIDYPHTQRRTPRDLALLSLI